MTTHIQIKCTDDVIGKGLRFAATACGMSLRQYTLYAAAKHTARLFAGEPWGFDDNAVESAFGTDRTVVHAGAGRKDKTACETCGLLDQLRAENARLKANVCVNDGPTVPSSEVDIIDLRNKVLRLENRITDIENTLDSLPG
jgi:hypothetical protein